MDTEEAALAVKELMVLPLMLLAKAVFCIPKAAADVVVDVFNAEVKKVLMILLSMVFEPDALDALIPIKVAVVPVLVEVKLVMVLLPIVAGTTFDFEIPVILPAVAFVIAAVALPIIFEEILAVPDKVKLPEGTNIPFNELEFAPVMATPAIVLPVIFKVTAV